MSAGFEVRPYRGVGSGRAGRAVAPLRLTRPWNDPERDIDRRLGADSAGMVVRTVEDRIVASVMAGYEGHRDRLDCLAVDPDQRSAGHGAAIMRAAEQLVRARECPKVSLQIRTTKLDAIRFDDSIGDVRALAQRMASSDAGPRRYSSR